MRIGRLRFYRNCRPMTRRQRLARDHYQWQVHRDWEGKPSGNEDWEKVKSVFLQETTWPKQLWRWVTFILRFGGWRIYREKPEESE